MSSTMSSSITQRSGKDTSIFDSPTFDKDLRIHVNQAVGSASISPGGRDVVLASQSGLHIIDLDSPFSPPRHLRHQTPWIPADVQWSPFASRYYWVVSTSNQRALVWNLELASLQAPIEHTLHAHSRAITDINFSPLQPDLLATCAVDAFVHCWDLRVSARPVISFSDWFAGATQVKWNRRNTHIVASSHDKYLHIWDDRKGALPLKTIEAHQTKIYGIDWSRTEETKIVTCSLDRTIKVWDYEVSQVEPERVINTPFPVWRARHTPFGDGVLAMPQRGDHDLHMYDCRPSNVTNTPALTEPNYRFTGHEEQVKEFLWRGRGNIDEYSDGRDFQLVSWGADRELILHRMGDKQLQSIGFHKGMLTEKPPQLTRIGAPYKSFRDRPIHPGIATESTAQGSELFHPGTSPGMNKVPIPIAGGWADGGQMMTYSGIETRNVRQQDNGLISWMKGVKFGKRKPSSPDRLTTRRLSIVADLHHPNSHGIRESLSDEIIHVGEKFTRVTVEEADVSNRHVKISLNGPWAAEDKLVFMQLCMDFPVDYPEKSVPWFHLDKASALSEKKVAELEGNLRKIATGYLIHRRGCIEGFLSYLTGERDLQESISWLGLGGHDVVAPGEEAESSSDEEDGLLGDFGGSGESQTLGMEGSVGSGIFSTNANVPLPRTCGALWAPNGQLICFMPPREEPRSILHKFAIDERSRNRGSREIFEGFGRLRPGQAESKAKSKPSADTFEADESDNSSEFSNSSSSSGSDEPELFLRRFQPPSAWHGGSLRFPRLKGLRTHSTEGSIPTSSGLNKRGVGVRNKVRIKILDVESLLPSKRSLASAYLVYGDGKTVCSHNARAAQKNGFPELADIWEFIGLVLAKEVPLSLLSIPRQETDIRVLARRLLMPSQRNDSGLDLSFDEPEAVLHPQETALIKWGTHPFAGSWLIDTLFTYFENLADIQMLGMLSCIFAQSLSPDDQRPTYEYLPQSMSCAAQLFDYFPDKETAFGFYEPIINVSDLSNRHRKSGAGLTPTGELSQDFREQIASEPVTPYTENTPPMPLSRASTHRSSAAHSLSTSPEHHRTSIPSATSSFAASVLARPFQLASSPPVRNRTSGEELSSSIPSQAGVNWSKSRPFTRSDATIRRSFMSQGFGDDYDGSTTEDDESLPPQSRVKISLKNQDLFDDEGCSSVAFLNPNQSIRFAVYRAAYANMLGAWGLQMQQNEVDKLDGLLSNVLTRTQSRDRGSQSTLTLGEVEDDQETLDGLGPQVIRCCMSCGEIENRERRGADRKCVKCGGRSHLLSCTICYQPIAGLYKVCLACGHSAHISCLAILLESLSGDEKPECEAGCGCACDENMAVGGEEIFGVSKSPTFEQEVEKETGFRMLQPVGNSTILNRRGSIVEARQSGRVREMTQEAPTRSSNSGLRRMRTRSVGH